jgi:hypothetical protein
MHRHGWALRDGGKAFGVGGYIRVNCIARYWDNILAFLEGVSRAY